MSCVAERASPSRAPTARRGCSSPAPPASPARSPPTCSGAIPDFELTAVTGRSEAGRRLDDLYPRYRVPLALEELDLDGLADVEAAIVAYPHAAAAPTVAALRERGVRVVDLSADYRLRSLATYEHWYGAHPRPELMARPSTGSPSCTASGSRAPRWSPTPAATRRRRCWRSPRSRAPG